MWLQSRPIYEEVRSIRVSECYRGWRLVVVNSYKVFRTSGASKITCDQQPRVVSRDLSPTESEPHTEIRATQLQFDTPPEKSPPLQLRTRSIVIQPHAQPEPPR